MLFLSKTISSWLVNAELFLEVGLFRLNYVRSEVIVTAPAC